MRSQVVSFLRSLASDIVRHVTPRVLADPQLSGNLIQYVVESCPREAAKRLITVNPRLVVETALGNDQKSFLNLVASCFADLSFSYSQEGEDLLLPRLFKKETPGFYVDVGAHHPVRFSNTYSLYLAGWRGVNLDATPGSMKPFQTLRPEDINIECAVSDRSDPIRFYLFAEGALNTIDADLATQYVELGWELAGTVEVKPRPLAEVLEQHLPEGQAIDLMSIDVEGGEMGVLKSNDWDRFHPDILIVEALDTPIAQLDTNSVIEFLRQRGYVPISKLVNSVILRSEV